jgi:FkbM family methyltransferase
MLIEENVIISLLKQYNINISGCLHIGAHECEELNFYIKLGLSPNDIVWIEAMPHKVKECIDKGIHNIYQNIISDKDDDIVKFNISNNGQSSSILDLKFHKIAHPEIIYVDNFVGKTITIDTFFKNNNLDYKKYNFWNLDIQGAELLALKGGLLSLINVKAIYIEVNEKELYENCGLITDIDNLLKKYGFIRIITKMWGSCGWGDALYIKS